MAYVYLLIAIIGEVVGTILLKEINGITSWIPLVGSIIGFALSLFFFSLSFRTIPMNIAYALWSSLGTLLMIVLSVVIWNETFSAGTITGILFIVVGIWVLQLFGSKKTKPSHIS